MIAILFIHSIHRTIAQYVVPQTGSETQYLGEWAMALPGSVQIPFLMYIIHQVIFCNVLENIFHLAVDISYSW